MSDDRAERRLAALHRADALMAIDRHADARHVLADLLADAEDHDALCRLAVCTHHLGDHHRALDLVNQALRVRPESDWPHRIAAMVLRDLHQPLEGLRAAEAAVSAAPWSAAAHLSLTLSRKAAGELDGARASLARARAIDPRLDELDGVAGLIELADQRLDAAEACFRAQLEKTPNAWACHNNLGVVASLKQRHVRAALHFTRSLRIHPHQSTIAGLDTSVRIALSLAITAVAAIVSTVRVTLPDGHWWTLLPGVVLLAAATAGAAAGWRRAPGAVRHAARSQLLASLAAVGVPALLLTGKLGARDQRNEVAGVAGAFTVLAAVVGALLPIDVGGFVAALAFFALAPAAVLLAGIVVFRDAQRRLRALTRARSRRR